MECEEKKILRDYNYDELESMKERNNRLQFRLKKIKAKLAEKSRQLTDVVIRCDIYTDQVYGVKNHLDKLLTNKLVQGSSAKHSSSGCAKADIQKAKNDLDRHTKDVMRSLEATGAYPLAFDYTESSTDYGTDDSAEFHKKSEVYDYDSDGNRIDSDYDD